MRTINIYSISLNSHFGDYSINEISSGIAPTDNMNDHELRQYFLNNKDGEYSPRDDGRKYYFLGTHTEAQMFAQTVRNAWYGKHSLVEQLAFNTFELIETYMEQSHIELVTPLIKAHNDLLVSTLNKTEVKETTRQTFQQIFSIMHTIYPVVYDTLLKFYSTENDISPNQLSQMFLQLRPLNFFDHLANGGT